jgi:hypothetical protein
MRDWRERAACLEADGKVQMFFEDIYPDTIELASGVERVGPPDREALATARSFCDRCPVRRECFAQALEDDDGNQVDFRFGLRGGMTPAQRWSAEHRKTVCCPVCDTVLDPNSIRSGEIACPNWCDIDRTLPPIPDEGDKWNRRHSTLARKVVRWIVEEVTVGAVLTSPSRLADQWQERRTDMVRLFKALVLDGTLEFDDTAKEYRRLSAPGAMRGTSRLSVYLRQTNGRLTAKQRRRLAHKNRVNPDAWVAPHLVMAEGEAA